MKLLIVESPTKANTLKRFLGSEFKVVSSLGHIRDLPKKELGVDIEQGFRPHYTVMGSKRKVISEIKDVSQSAQEVYIATDPDREGESIGWHILQAVGLKERKNQKSKSKDPVINRIVFHEITKEALEEALRNPRRIDMQLVEAQQARRILDRLVGYKLSPLLWRKVRAGLSAGRVQSVAVRLIVDREKEREAFVPKEYWTIEAYLNKISGEKDAFKAALLKHRDKKIEIKTEKGALKIIEDLKGATYEVIDLKKSEKKRNPYPPFVTATLQRASVNVLGFTSSRTMKASQNLYEAGFITYMRTDSVHLSPQAIKQTREYINENFGETYLPVEGVRYKTKTKGAQEAHEAIRPTDIRRLPTDPGVGRLGRDEARIYNLIFKRMVACQMLSAVYDQLIVDIKAYDYLFRSSGRTLKFEGWLKVEKNLSEEAEGSEGEEVHLPPLEVGEKLLLLKLDPQQHFTQPPPRYTEATLIKELEKEGIGRPSTYAPIIGTIQAREYVAKEGKYFYPEDVGSVVTELLVKHFPEIVAIKFTAQMEADLDEIAVGKKEWQKVLGDFYEPFAKNLEKKQKELKKEEITELEKTAEKCPECGKVLVVKLGRYGKFLSCSGFPECRHREPYVGAPSPEVTGEGEIKNQVDKSQLEGKCPECGSKLVLKEGRFGKFIACSQYPKCEFTKNYLDKIGMNCPMCREGAVIRKKTRRGKFFYGCSNYPKCKYASWTDPRKDKSEILNSKSLF